MGKECTIKSWACDWCLRRGGRLGLVVVREGEREVDGGGGEGRGGGWGGWETLWRIGGDDSRRNGRRRRKLRALKASLVTKATGTGVLVRRPGSWRRLASPMAVDTG